MPWDNEFALPFGPDIVPSAMTNQAPAQLAKRPLQVTAFHAVSLHQYVYGSTESQGAGRLADKGHGGRSRKGELPAPDRIGWNLFCGRRHQTSERCHKTRERCHPTSEWRGCVRELSDPTRERRDRAPCAVIASASSGTAFTSGEAAFVISGPQLASSGAADRAQSSRSRVEKRRSPAQWPRSPAQ